MTRWRDVVDPIDRIAVEAGWIADGNPSARCGIFRLVEAGEYWVVGVRPDGHVGDGVFSEDDLLKIGIEPEWPMPF